MLLLIKLFMIFQRLWIYYKVLDLKPILALCLYIIFNETVVERFRRQNYNFISMAMFDYDSLYVL